ncbi:MAG: Mpv17/PMP22 family protein [Bacteroidales bacterium]|nr:Mpv17/PMP22 family protein [Bacteroidales bacterium]
MVKAKAGIRLSDILVATIVVVLLLPFFLFPSVYEAYRTLNAEHGYLMAFVKFAFLATFGECIGLRIRTGKYYHSGFGLIPRALVWGFLGITIKIAFVIFGEGAPYALKTMGVVFPDPNPAYILRSPEFSGLKLLSAFAVGVTLNLFFAPVFMIFHRITDMHIIENHGTIRGFFTPIRVGYQISHLDWNSMWNFVLKKTVPFFWIPAQTLNFLLPEEWRVLVAAIYSIILGVLLSVASLMEEKRV